jgi:hypothetical protein
MWIASARPKWKGEFKILGKDCDSKIPTIGPSVAAAGAIGLLGNTRPS